MGPNRIDGSLLRGLLLFSFVALCPLLVFGDQVPAKRTERELINWTNVKQALAIYDSCPNRENAQKLLGAIPKPPAAYQYGNREVAGLAILENSAFDKAVVAGDAVLAEAAFRLIGYMGGGAVDEELRIALGRFLVRNPGEFLRLLKRYEYLFASERDYPVNMTEIQEIVPDVITEGDLRRLTEEGVRLYEKRIRALETVDDPELMQVRDACIKVIRDLIQNIHYIGVLN